MADKNTHTELFDSYLSGELPELELQTFEEKIQSDSVLAKAFEEHVNFIKGIQFAQEKKTRDILKSVQEELSSEDFFNNSDQTKIIDIEKNGAKPFRFRRLLAYAASSLILFGFIFFYLTADSSLSSEELFAEFYHPEQTLLPGILDRLEADGFSTEAKDENIQLAAALQKYESGDFKTSRIALNDFLSTAPDNKIAAFYLGLTLLELKEFPIAAARLASLSNDNSFKYTDTAKWYAALAYGKFETPEGKDNARRLMQEIGTDNQSKYNDKAREYLKALK